MAKKKPIVSKEGQWKYPGQETIIPNANGRITMQGVPYPVLGIDDLGHRQMMMPGAEYQFPGNSVYEIPMAKNGGTKKVKIHGLPKAQNGEEVQTVYTAGTNEPWEPLPEMTPQEAKQWRNLRDDAVGITGNYATNQQIYATYKRAKEMGIGYDQYVSNEKAKAQKQREAIVPKTIPGWDLSIDELKELSKLPGSPIMYNGNTGQYSFPNLEMYDPQQPYMPGSKLTRGEIALSYYPSIYNMRAQRINERNAQYINELNAGTITPEFWEKLYGSPYDPNKNYTVTPDELKQHHWTGPSEDLRGRGANDYYFDGYGYMQEFAPYYLTYTHHRTPDEVIMQEAYQGAKEDMNTPFAKFLGSKGEPPKSVLERNYRIAADKIANESITSLQNIIGGKANSEAVRSVLDMDPKIFEDIINSPFKSGSITLDSNKHGWGKKLTINDKEAKAILRNIEFIKRSGKYNFLLDPSPADMAIQGIGNTLSWMAGNDNAEGPGTIGEAFHNFTGNTAHNKGYNLFNTFESPLVAGRNIVENIAAPILSNYKGTSGIRTLDDPGQDFFTEVPTMRGMNMTWNPNYSQLENDIANFTYAAAQDAALSGIGQVARPLVSKTLNTFTPVFRKSFLTDNPKAYFPNSSFSQRVRNTFEPEVGFNLSNNEVAAELAKTKSQFVSPFDLTKYNFAPGSSTGRLRGKPLFEDFGTSNYAFGTNRKLLTEEGANYFNKKYGLNYKQYDKISNSDLQKHIGDVFDYHAPKPSKTPGGVKYKSNFLNDIGIDDAGFKISNKWTKDELANAKRTALDFDLSDLNRAKDVHNDITSKTVKNVLYGASGIGGLLVGRNLMENEGKPLYNKAVPYLNAGARKLGFNSNPFSLATPSGTSSTEGTKNQVLMSLNDEGNTVSSARVNETADGDVIIGGEFIEDTNNTVNKASWFKENPDIPLSDKNFTAKEAKGFYGVEDGKFKAGKLEDFKPETVVVPIRPFENSYEPVTEAGVTGDKTLRLLTNPKDPNNPDSGIIYNNATQSGKMMFYSPSTKNAWFIYNADPATTAEQINKLISENSDIRYIPIDNGRYEHYIDKQEGPLNENDFKEYYAADVGRQGNPGYNIVLKRKGKKLGGPIYRTGGELPKAQFGPPTAQDSAMVASKANQVGNWLVNNGYTKQRTEPANLANSAAFRQDLEGGGRRFQDANNSGNIVDFRTGNRGSFPGNYTMGYTGYNPVWQQRDMAPAVLNPNTPPSYYDTRILPQKFDIYDASNQFGDHDVVGKYTYEKLAVTPWKKLTTEEKIKRLKRYGSSGSPYKDPKVGIKELKGILEDEKSKKTAKVEPPVVDKPVQIPSQPEDIKIPFKPDITRRQYPIKLTGDAGIDKLNMMLFGPNGSLTEDGYIPLDDPKYNPYVGGIGSKVPPVRVSYGKFQRGGDVSIPDLRRVKIDGLPKAQTGINWSDPLKSSFPEPQHSDWYNTMSNMIPQEQEVDWRGAIESFGKPKPYVVPNEYYEILKRQESNGKDGYKDGKYYPYKSPEGGNYTIGYGHKLTDKEVSSGKFKDGITNKDVDNLFQGDVDEHLERAKQRYDSAHGKGAFEKLHPELKTLALDFTYNGIDLSSKDDGYPKFWGAANQYSTSKDEAIRQQAYQTMLNNYVRNLTDPQTKKLVPLGARNQYTLDVLNKIKRTGGELPKAQKGKEWLGLGYENKVYTYKDNPEFFDSHARLSDNPRYNDWIKKTVYSGNWGYNPVTGESVRLNANQQTNVSPETKTLAKDVRNWTKEEKVAHPASTIKNLPRTEVEQLRKENKGFDQYATNAEKEAGKRTAAAQSKAMVNNPAFYAPGTIGALAIAPELLATELFGTGLSLGNIVNPLFIGHGIKNTFDPNSDMRQSWSKAYDNPNTSNILNAAKETGLNSLNFLGAKALPGDIKAFGNAYNRVATGNSAIPYAWRVERPNFPIKSTDYIARPNTDAEIGLLDKFGKGMGRLTPEEWAQMEELTRSGATDFSNGDYPISRILGYYERGSAENKLLEGLKRGDVFHTPTEKTIRTWSVGTPGKGDLTAYGNTRLVVPSRYTKGLGNNFGAMPYNDKRLPFIWNPETGRINSRAVAEKEIMGNIPNGFKVIGSSNENGLRNLIIKPLNSSVEPSNITLNKWPQLFGNGATDSAPVQLGPQAELDLANARAKAFSESAFNKLKLQRFRPGQTFDVTNQEARFMDDPELAKVYDEYYATDPDNPNTVNEWFREGHIPHGPSGRYGANTFGDPNDIVAINKVNETTGTPAKNILLDTAHETTHSRSIRLKSTQPERDIVIDAWKPMVDEAKFETGPTSGLDQAAEESFAVQNELRNILNDFDGSRVYTDADIPEIQNALQKLSSTNHPYLSQNGASQIDIKKLIKSLNVIGLGAAVPAVINATQEKKNGGQLSKAQFGGNPAKRFNTKLRGAEREAFNQHAQQFPSLLHDNGDYDTQGFYQAVYRDNNGDMGAVTKALTPGSDTAHVGFDMFKKPNHPTFSKESKYYIPGLRPAGEWGHNQAGDYFDASRHNIRNMKRSDGTPLEYFKRAEDYDQNGTPDVNMYYRGKTQFDTENTPAGTLQPKLTRFGFQTGGPTFKTKLAPNEEEQFKGFYRTLPDNLRSDDASYDIRGYWDASGRPSQFDYSQPTEDDGYYHAFSRHPETGKILKSPGHPTFHMAVDERNIEGNTYVPVVGPDGNVYMRDLSQDAEDLQRQKHGGSVKRVKIKSLPNNWKTK